MTPTPSFRSSGTLLAPIQQKDGQVEIVVAQVNIIPVTAADEGAMGLVLRAAVGTINDQNETTMGAHEIVQALRDAANHLEAQQ